MSFIFGKQKEQGNTVLNITQKEAADPAAMEAAAQAKAEAAEKERRKRAKGGLATILTSAEGVAGPAPLLTKTLLGE